MVKSTLFTCKGHTFIALLHTFWRNDVRYGCLNITEDINNPTIQLSEFLKLELDY